MKKGMLYILTAIGAGVFWALASRYTEPADQVLSSDAEDSYLTSTPEDTNLKADIKRFGTRQQLIDVANTNADRQIKKRQLKSLSTLKLNRPEPQNHTTQITIQNLTAESQSVDIWKLLSETDPNSGGGGGSSSVGVLSQTQSVSIPQVNVKGYQPNSILYNPANDYIYVTDSMADAILVLDSQGNLVHVFDIGESLAPGIISPGRMAVIPEVGNPFYGYVFVVCTVSDEIVVLRPNNTIRARVNTDSRPMEISWLQITNQLYVSCYGDNKLNTINPLNLAGAGVAQSGTAPIGVLVHEGFIHVANSRDNTVTILNKSKQLVATIPNVQSEPIGFIYYPPINKVLVIAEGDQTVYPIDKNGTNFTLGNPIAVGDSPVRATIFNSRIYMYNQGEATYSIIDENLEVIEVQEAPVDLSGQLVHPVTNEIWTVSPSGGTIQLQQEVDTAVVFNPEYPQIVREFTNAPVVIRALKWVFSGAARPATLQVQRANITGKAKIQSIPFLDHPMNFINAMDMTALNGSLIDKHTCWTLTIQPSQTITLLLQYQQIKPKQFLQP